MKEDWERRVGGEVESPFLCLLSLTFRVLPVLRGLTRRILRTLTLKSRELTPHLPTYWPRYRKGKSWLWTQGESTWGREEQDTLGLGSYRDPPWRGAEIYLPMEHRGWKDPLKWPGWGSIRTEIRVGVTLIQPQPMLSALVPQAHHFPPKWRFWECPQQPSDYSYLTLIQKSFLLQPPSFLLFLPS